MATLVRGDFVWKDGVCGSEVIFETKENGRFLVADYPIKKIEFKK